MAQTQKLSDIQLHLLRFFSERQVSTEETLEIQRIIALYYAKKADVVMDDLWLEKEFDERKMFQILNQSFDSTKS